MARVALPICLLVLLFAGCGGGGGDDKKDAEQTVRDFVRAVNTRDADTYCDDLITKSFREKSTFATGDRASESCKREMKAITGLHIKLVRIARTEVDGDSATVTAVLARSGQRIKQPVQLKQEDGRWRIDGTGAG